jgi:hypothetical protein
LSAGCSDEELMDACAQLRRQASASGRWPAPSRPSCDSAD